MADISKLEQQANLLMNNVSGWEQNTLTRIGKRIKKYGKLSLADVKSINNIAVVKSDMEAITKELAKVTGYNISQIEQMYGELLEEQHLANQPLYDYRGKKFVPFAENRELQAIARAYAKTTGETMINLAKTKSLGILDSNGKTIGLQKYYTDILDKAVMQVASGATDFHTAMRDSIVELGGSGVRVDYGGGVTRRLDTVVRQNLLWGAKQASVEYNEMIGEELGCDGYEVDWHSNPRPSHAFMQGKQYVLGKARTINGIHFESADEALERLQDYGCLHYKTPIICGISEPRYSPEELKRLNEQNAKRYTIDGKEYSGYEVTQMQRRIESSVRNEKTTRELARASGDNALVKRCNERIRAYQGKYNEISEITGIQGDKKRMSVTKGGTPSVPSTNAKIKPSVEKGMATTDAKITKAKINSEMSSGEIRQRMQEIEKAIDDVPMDKDWLDNVAKLERERDELNKTLSYALEKESKGRVIDAENSLFEKDYFAAKTRGKNGAVDISMADENCAKAIESVCDAVFEKYPQLKGKLSGISVSENGALGMGFREGSAGHTVGTSHIYLNSKRFSNFGTLDNDLIKNFESGFHSVTGVKGAVVHEFGHSMDVYLSKDGDVFSGMYKWKSVSGKIQKEVLSELKLPKEAISEGLSKYATHSSEEFFAEAFAEYTLSPNPRPIAKKFGEILERELAKLR